MNKNKHIKSIKIFKEQKKIGFFVQGKIYGK